MNASRSGGGDFRWMRRPARPEDRSLSPEAVRFLGGLPPQATAVQCGARYPRLVNRMAALSGKSSELLAYVVELSSSKSGGRQGFPEDVAKELASLRRYLESKTVDTGVWKDQFARIR